LGICTGEGLAQKSLGQTFTCRNTQAISSQLFFLFTRPMKMEQTQCSETSTHNIQTPGSHPKERIQHSKHAKVWNQEWKSMFCSVSIYFESILLTSG